MQEQVRGYFADRVLRSAKLEAILADAASAGPGLGGPRVRRFWPAAAAAAVLLVLVVWWALPPAAPTDLVVREIALNHVKALSPDRAAKRFEELAEMKDKLGFAPVWPEGLSDRGLTLAGARYCSVQGCMAAQVSVVDGTGEPWTLYQVRPDARLDRLGAAKRVVDGVEVELWREAGLVMGLARSR